MGKTITTYLMTGDPKGSQYVLISNRVCKMIVIPRSEISIAYEREELRTPSFYILLGQADDASPMAYIGQTEDFAERVKQHDQKKQFWNKAIIFISIGGAMTKADVEYLEFKGYKLAKKVKRYNLAENKQEPKEPHLPEHQKDAMNDYFEDCKFLVSFIGCDLFEEEKKEGTKDQLTFYLTHKGYITKGVYSTEGMTVLQDSHIMKDGVPSYKKNKKNYAQRQEWVKENTYEKDGELYLKANFTFESPSTACQFCLGSSLNGWKNWKTKDKRDLDSVYRNLGVQEEE